MCGTKVSFSKLHGCGNDFIVIDLRVPEQRTLIATVDAMASAAQKLCKRNFSIGADGAVFIDFPIEKEASYKWHFYNADGSRADMCGNATRCVAYWAVYHGFAPREHMFESDVGCIQVSVDMEHATVTTLLPPPHSLQEEMVFVHEGRSYMCTYVNTGVPHIVCFVEDVEKVDVHTIGRYIRYHALCMPEGANVNFAQFLPDATILVRTYERGVEGETFACGTGACAVGVVAHRCFGKTAVNTIRTLNGDAIVITDGERGVTLEAPVCFVYKGDMVHSI